jgi:2-keto-4-pentenoate hydratase/2-oxohepta-3-ene-1,7-dioic acid hydratase in catechol pathway
VSVIASAKFVCKLLILYRKKDPIKALEAVGAVTAGLDLTLRDLQGDLKASLGNVRKHLMVLAY